MMKRALSTSKPSVTSSAQYPGAFIAPEPSESPQGPLKEPCAAEKKRRKSKTSPENDSNAWKAEVSSPDINLLRRVPCIWKCAIYTRFASFDSEDILDIGDSICPDKRLFRPSKFLHFSSTNAFWIQSSISSHLILRCHSTMTSNIWVILTLSSLYIP